MSWRGSGTAIAVRTCALLSRPASLFQKCILHISFYFKIGVGIRYIIQVSAKYQWIWAIS